MTRRFETDVLAHYVPAVLEPNGRYEKIRDLLTCVDYLAAKVGQLGPEAVVADIRAAERLAPTPAAALELRTLEAAVVESARILRADPGQLRGQLLSRVPRRVAADVDALLDAAAQWREGTWLRPSGQIGGSPHGYLASFGPAEGFVNALAVSDDAAVLIAGDRDGGLQAWDLRSRQQLWRQDTGTAVKAVTFRPASFEAFVALGDGTIARWSLADRRLRTFASLDAGPATSLAVGASTLVYSCAQSVYGQPWQGTAAPWQVTAPGDDVAAVAVLGDGKRAVSCSYDGSVAVWSLSDGNQIDHIQLTKDRMLCAAAVPGSNSVAVGTRDRLVLVIDLDTGRVVTLRGHTNQVRSVAGLHDGRVASGSYDGQVLAWDLAALSSRRIGSHSSWCLSVAAPRHQGPVVSGSNDGLVCVWDPNGDAVEALHGQGVRSLAVGAGVAYASVGRDVRRLDLATGQQLPPFVGHRRQVVALAIAPGGLVSSSYDGTVRLWKAGTGMAVVLASNTGGADAIAITPDGKEIVSVARDATCRQWDAATGEAGPTASGSERTNPVLAFSPDGETMITATIKHAIEVRHRRSGRRLLPPLEGHVGYVARLLVTPDGSRLISGSWDRTVRMWDLGTGVPLRVLRHSGGVLDLALAPDGRCLLAACDDGSIVVIDVDQLKVTATIDAHHDSVDRLALSRDGSTLFSIGSGQLRAWYTRSLSELAVFDVDVPLHEIAIAGPDLVVVGTAVGSIIPISLERQQTPTADRAQGTS